MDRRNFLRTGGMALLGSLAAGSVLAMPSSAKGAMGVTEFALLYFPESPPETAYKRMWVWIRTSRGLKEKLLAAGWVKFQKLYTPKQVACLVEHLGEP